MQNAAPEYKQLYGQSQLRIVSLEQQLQQLQKMIFGSRQERFVPAIPNDPQLLLDIPAEAVAAVSVTNAQKISYVRQGVTVEAKPLAHPGRMKLPESLRVNSDHVDPGFWDVDPPAKRAIRVRA